jgi:hypothetical protein
MCMTQSGLDAVEWELRDHDPAVMTAHRWWSAIVILRQQNVVDGVLPSLFAEDWTVDGCEQSRWWPVGE